MSPTRLAAVFASFLLPIVAAAQSGTVRSGSQPVPGAEVTAKIGDQKFTAITNPDGRYRFASLPAAAAASISVQMFGFQPVTKTANTGDSAKSVDFNLQLAPSALVERLSQLSARTGQAAGQIETQLQAELSSAQPSAAPSAAESGGTGSNEAFLVSGSLSQGLAANAPPDTGGNPQGFDRNGPGGDGQSIPGFGGGPPNGGGGFGGRGGGGGGFGGGGFGGGRGGFDGQRQGGGPGRAQFGNRRQPAQVRGMVFFSLDNSALNARPFSISGLDLRQPSYAQSRFGVVAGGPLLIPKLIHDRNTFFSFSYTGTRARNPYSAFTTVPSALERTGDFSQAVQSAGPVQIFDPQNRLPFPGNIIPAQQIDSIAQKLLRFYPLPNAPGLVNNFAFYASVPQNTDNVALRLQRSVTKVDRLAFHINVQRRDGSVDQPFGFKDVTSGQGLTTDLQWTRNISAHLISAARVTFNRNRNETTPFFANAENTAAALGIAGTSTNPLDYGPPNLNFTNFGSLSDANPILIRNQAQGAGENVTWIRGRHSFVFGAQFQRNDLNTRTDPNGRGTFNFTGLLTSAFTPQGQPLPGTGFDFADYLLGLPQSSSIRFGSSNTYFAQNTLSGFVTDDFKVTSRLTLNLGIRYEYFAPFTEKYGRMANLDIAPGYAAVSVVTPNSTGPYSGKFPAGLIDGDYKDFSPRLGLAWKVPYLKRSTIVRMGYGIYYNGQIYNSFASRLAQQPPFAVSNSINTSSEDVLTLAGGFISTLPSDITNTFAVDRHYRTPYVQTWNLEVQHELPHGIFADVNYLGAKGTRLDIETLPNEGPPGSQTFRRNQTGNALGFVYDSSNGNSVFHALQARLNQRFRRGLSWNAFYTFSKSIDDSSSFGGAGNTVAQNWLDLRAERGLSSFDRRHSFDLTGLITSQAGAAGSHFAAGSAIARLLKDWQLSGTLTAQTGTPLTARALGNAVQLAQTGGIGSGRADATGLDLSGAGFFNTAAFTAPPPGQFGDAGRNTIPGPGLISLNLAFGRSFQLDESRRRLELRLEASNVFNHVNYTNVDTVVNAINYGAPISAAGMRTVNVVLRFRF